VTLALSGQVVEPGIAIGQAHNIQRNEIEIGEYRIEADQVEAEVERLLHAAGEAREHLETLAGRLAKAAGAAGEEIIRTHLAMLEDSSLVQASAGHIREQLCNAEWALQLHLESLVAEFRAIDDAYIRSREEDVVQVVRMVQRVLAEAQTDRPLDEVPDRLGQTLVVATELTPNELAILHDRGVAGVITEHGSPYSHTAILARGMGIPIVMGVRRAQALITEGEQLVLDGAYGIVFADPEESILRHYLQKQSESDRYRRLLERGRGRPARSLDGESIVLLANAERPVDIRRAMEDGAEGVGLFRSEYLFMQGTSLDEEAQLECYREALEALGGAPLTIRTLDAGADKPVRGLVPEGLKSMANPALGLRAVRLCLRQMDFFKVQLRAILRAAALGPVNCMIPMLTMDREVLAVRSLLDETRLDLEREGIAHGAADMKIGGMIEVPAAALALERIGRHLDFISVGTNDLIQYALAADRVDESVAHLYDPLHPGVLQLLRHIFDTAGRLRLPVAVCGEMAGDRRFTRLLLALGLREFSMQPRSLLEVKKIVNETDIGTVREALERWERGDADGAADHGNLAQYLDQAQLHR
jgi:phosphotransferase system enzyme I (PtsI)